MLGARQMSHTGRKYFVNDGSTNLGPWDVTTIVEKVEALELKATDYLYLDDKDEWVMICQYPEFIETVAAKKTPTGKPTTAPTSRPTTTTKLDAPVPKNTGDVVAFGEKTSVAQRESKPEAQTNEWYVLKGKNRYGPFPFFDVLRMLQEKALFEFDYVWKPGLETWNRIAEVPDFHPDHVRKLFEQQDSETFTPLLFFRRRHPRNYYECPVIVHDNAKVWKGATVEISEGGAGVVMENAMVLPGQNIYLHFKPGPDTQPFNVLCEVVSKKYAKGVKDKSTPIQYGLKFINIQKQDRDALKQVTRAA
jgi:hypothetical protein